MLRGLFPGGMCDLPEEELAEYLLWTEYALARSKAAERAVRIRAPAALTAPREPEPEPLPA
jgi:hypothetical protein